MINKHPVAYIVPFCQKINTILLTLCRSLKNSPSLITWRLIETKMCWGVIFLLGGGFALADASQKSGLSTLLISQLNQLDLANKSIWLVNFVICVMTVTVSGDRTRRGVTSLLSDNEHRVQHRHGQRAGADTGRDGGDSLYQPDISHSSCWDRLLLRLCLASRHRSQCDCVRSQLNEDK